MKKVLIISLFGLFLAHESSAMFVRAAKTVSRLAPLGLLAGTLESSSEGSASIDISEKEAQAIYDDYKCWAAQNNKMHESITDKWREQGVQTFSKQEIFDRLGINVRECTLQEKTTLKNTLCEYGFSEEESCAIVEKIFITDSCPFSFDAIYNRFKFPPLKINPPAVYCSLARDRKEALILSYNVVLEIMLNNKAAIQVMLHEVMHYKHMVGHKIQTNLEENRLKEEQRAEIESLRRMSPEDLTDSSFTKPLLLELSPVLPDKILVPLGYVARSGHVRKVIADGVERERLQEAQELLKKIDRAERA